MILLALLLAAAPPPPDRVVMVARAKDKPGVFAKLQDSVSRAWHRLYEKGEPNVEQGNALAAEGKPEAALSEYDVAHQKLPDSPELAYDRSTALVKMDPAKAPEAASEALQALQHGDASLKSKAAYQLGVSQEAMGKPEEAMKSYGAALALDPDDEDSKVNLELLLKTQEERKQKQPQPQQQKDKKDQQEKKDQQQQSKGGEDKDKKDDQSKQGKDEQKKKEAQQKPEEPKPDENKKDKQAQAEEKPVDRSEAERLLDALRASEKNLQTWRFAKDKRNNARRSESEKDW
jgi:Ca-activated chloride channel family protein